MLLVGVEDWLVSMISERFMELVERVSMCGGFVAIVKRLEIVDEEVKIVLWLVQLPS